MRARLLRASARLIAASALALSLGACAAAPAAPVDPLKAARDAAATSADGEVIGRWLLDEMFAPGGDAARAKAARDRLDKLAPAAQKSLFASLARAIYDHDHGRFQHAALAHIDAIDAAVSSQRPDAPLVAWYSANQLLRLRASVANLWDKAQSTVMRAIDHPGNLGWRARGELIEWWSLDGFRKTQSANEKTPEGLLDAAAKRYGCAEKARLAGPFGHLAPGDHRVHYEPERAGPWPAAFKRDPLRLEAPRTWPVERVGCALRATGAPRDGIYYVESFLDLPADREVIVAVQGALAIYVDDVEVLSRDTRLWGIWPRFGARLRLEGGRHRILARVGGAETSIRLLAADGTPLGIATSDDPAPPYTLTPPTILDDPNALAPFMRAIGVPDQPGSPKAKAPRDTSDPISRVLAAYLAHVESQDDLSNVLIEPLVSDPAKAAGPALALQAIFFEKDPIFTDGDARDLAKDARARAASKDPELWLPRMWLALDQADKAGIAEIAPQVAELADHFREVPDLLLGLASLYARVGWRAEYEKTVREAAARFPDNVDALSALLDLYELQGQIKEADAIAVRIRELDPDAEVEFDRALTRRDFAAAIQELKRLGSLRKDRRDIAVRIADLLTRAGATRESMKALEAAVQKKPQDAGARLALADARFAAGEKGALRKALVDAILAGAEPAPLRDAIELIDGITELSPYRIDGEKAITEYEASGRSMPGTAARVLDYSAIWVHPDGSARMLEYEIIGVQSREAIQELAEQRLPRGIILKLRTVKRDGRVLEPEFVEGKPTVTMPHLEVGDYIETETVTNLRGDGQGGLRFEGPRWFFREEKIPYWRSEFIVISPKNKPLDIETGGSVPAPSVSESGALSIRRWRVDESPALPEEPASAPIQEFLPNVRIGWGIDLKGTVARMVDAVSDETPRDPRLARIAERIVQGEDKKGDIAKLSKDERARRIYRWVLANVEGGDEGDPRRAIVGKSGNRTSAFLYLCRLNGIEAELGVVRDRLAPPATGPMSETEAFASVAVRIVTEKGPRWMVVRDKFAPYGYMPSALRGQPAIVLKAGAPRETTPTGGSNDGVTHEGTAEVAADGSAMVELEQRYEGKLAILLRTALETLPEARLKDTVEAKLLPRLLPGARVISVDIKNQANLDAPLILAMKLEMSNFARPQQGELLISPPFPLQVSSLASLQSRETPLYFSEQIATRVAIKLRVKLPEGAKVMTAPVSSRAEDDGRLVQVSDRVEPGAVVLDRLVDLPAGRVQPKAYPAFQEFATRADSSLHRDILVSLPAR